MTSSGPDAAAGAQLLSGSVATRSGVVPHGAVVVADGRVVYVGPRRDLPPMLAHATEPPGWRRDLLLMPGLVDIHCHGGGGGEFGPDRAAAYTAAAHHHRAGTTTVVASLVSAPRPQLWDGVRACAPLVADGAVAGLHLEGPFLSTVRCGAQDPAALLAPDHGLVEDLVTAAGAGSIVQMTFAPELPGAAALPGALAEHGVLGAMGHTDADAATARAAFTSLLQAGARGGQGLATHVFNGMPPLLSRRPGPVGAALSAAGRGEAVLEVIADGVHLDADTVRMLFDTVGPDQIALVSDCTAAGGLPDGRYTLGGRPITVRGREVRLAQSDSLAGGVSTLLEQLRWCTTELGVPLEDVVRAASSTPARTLGLRQVGDLSAGKRADVVVTDRSLTLQRVMRAGCWLPEDDLQAQ